MLSKSSKWELGLVRYITKFTILRFVISRFECICFSNQLRRKSLWRSLWIGNRLLSFLVLKTEYTLQWIYNEKLITKTFFLCKLYSKNRLLVLTFVILISYMFFCHAIVCWKKTFHNIWKYCCIRQQVKLLILVGLHIQWYLFVSHLLLINQEQIKIQNTVKSRK